MPWLTEPCLWKQKGWYLHNTQCLDPFHIYLLKFHLMKSSSEVEEKTQELVSRFVWIHGARARSTHRVIHLHSIKSAPRPSALARIFLVILFGAWFSFCGYIFWWLIQPQKFLISPSFQWQIWKDCLLTNFWLKQDGHRELRQSE